jgi:hypothetical protein
MAVWTPWIHEESGLSARFKTEGGGGDSTNLVKQMVQPDRPQILKEIAEERKQASLGNKPKDLAHGRYIGSIPMIDYMRMQRTHPDMFSPDRDIARAATIKFMNSTEAEMFRVQKA